ncbi:sialic acid-binding Ig-like lectin 9 [Xyrauchen texanus]|uniref:sialic acid-binding Ig-like lectin 9 n=1 Tax=Xyrauchen texanus TaxID=154827 RepID=UPI0022427190|nr:sialic acid-binding Ig-like lectin 9 [Xyrauchen texanus]
MQWMKSSVGVQREWYLVLLCVLHIWIGSTNGCLVEGGDYDFSLRLEENHISALGGCVRIPCAFTAPMRAHSGRQVWFRGSPEFPLSSPEADKQDNLIMLASVELECSIILRDLIGQDRTEEYGLMLEWGTDKKHIFSERVKVSTANLTLSTGVLIAGERTFLSCSFQVSCPDNKPEVIWKGLGSKQLSSTFGSFSTKHYSEKLLYTPFPEDHQKEVTCEATFGRNLSTNVAVTLTVYSHPQILNSSACTLQQDLLTCVCVSQGVPLPDIHWPLLQDDHHTTTVRASDGHITVNSTFTMTDVDFTINSTVMCISRNDLGLANKTLKVNIIEGLQSGHVLKWTFRGLAIALLLALIVCALCIWIRTKSQRLTKETYSALEEKVETEHDTVSMT